MPNKSKIDFLAEIYREAQIKLISIISGKYGAGTKTYYNSVLKQVEALMKQLSAGSQLRQLNYLPLSFRRFRGMST